MSFRYLVCEFSGLGRGVGEVFALLGCYVAYVVSCLPTFQNSVTTHKSQGLTKVIRWAVYVARIGNGNVVPYTVLVGQNEA